MTVILYFIFGASTCTGSAINKGEAFLTIERIGPPTTGAVTGTTDEAIEAAATGEGTEPDVTPCVISEMIAPLLISAPASR